MSKKYPWKQAVITGIIVAVFAIGSFSIAESLNKQFTWGIQTATLRGLTGLLTIVILGIGIYIGMRSIKISNSGKLTYGQALLAGFIIALTTGLITAFLGLIYCNIINPSYSDYMIAESKKVMTADGKSSTEIAAAMPALKQQWSTGGQMVQALIGQTVCGMAITLILGIFIKTKK